MLAPLSSPARASGPGDAFADAIPIGLPGELAGSTEGYTFEPGEPKDCAPAGSPTAWFRFVAPADEAVVFSTLGSSFDTVLSVYTGSALADLDLEVCNDDGFTRSSASRLAFQAQAGAVYWVQLGGWSGAWGSYRLFASRPPANDSIGQAVDASYGFDEEIDFVGASSEPGEPASCDRGATMSKWYRLEAPVRSEVVAVVGDGWAIALDAYRRGADGSLARVGCAGAARHYEDRLNGSLRFVVEPGATYYVRVASHYNTTDRLRILPLHLDYFRHPHDAPSTARVVEEPGFTDETLTLTAASIGEPALCGAGATVWYRYTATSPAPLAASTEGSNFDTIVGVYRQDGDKLTLLACNDDSSRWGLLGPWSLVRVLPEPGKTYLFQVGGYDHDWGAVRFELLGAPL